MTDGTPTVTSVLSKLSDALIFPCPFCDRVSLCYFQRAGSSVTGPQAGMLPGPTTRPHGLHGARALCPPEDRPSPPGLKGPGCPPPRPLFFPSPLALCPWQDGGLPWPPVKPSPTPPPAGWGTQRFYAACFLFRVFRPSGEGPSLSRFPLP